MLLEGVLMNMCTKGFWAAPKNDWVMEEWRDYKKIVDFTLEKVSLRSNGGLFHDFQGTTFFK